MNDCNEGARKMERMEEICVLQTQIEFRTKVRERSVDKDNRRHFREGFLNFCLNEVTSEFRSEVHASLHIHIWMRHSIYGYI